MDYQYETKLPTSLHLQPLPALIIVSHEFLLFTRSSLEFRIVSQELLKVGYLNHLVELLLAWTIYSSEAKI